MDEVLKDRRFAHIAKDPRYRRVPRGERKVKIDKRFKSMFKDKRFKLKYSVDKRGRPVNLTSNENLKKYYELSDDDENSSESDEEEKDEKENNADVERTLDQSDIIDKKSKATTDTDHRNDNDDDSEDISSSDDGNVEKKITLEKRSKDKRKQSKKSKQKQTGKRQEDAEESDSAESLHNRDDTGVDFARGEGNMESSSSEDDDDDDNDDDDDIDNKPGLKGEFDHKWGEIDQNVERVPEATRRLAMCNMDWDRVKAKDIFMLLHSFKPTNGVIHSVKIYPSEFGKERMADENAYGPKELRETKLDSDEEDGTVEDKEGTSYHTEKLRQYQLNRLKYYYAVVECDNVETANTIYEECDGMEYETSATKLDLRFIPDDMVFEDDAKSECTELPAEYMPSLFTNTALSQSKVDLTWDETDRARVQLTSKQFTTKKKEVDDADLQAYLASSSDEEGVDYGKLIEASDRESESEDEEKQIEKYKQLLQDIDKNEDRKKKKDVQMEITWEPGLREATEGMIKKKQIKALTPWEEYLQKKKEKKERKREERKEKHESREKQLENSDLDQDLDEADDNQAFSDDDLPGDFDQSDPFFMRDDDERKKKTVKEKKKKKTRKEGIEDENEDEEKAELSLLMMEERDDSKKHFSLDKLIEDSSGKKKKKKKKLEKQKKQKDEDDFKMQLDDPRFSAVYSSHLYNIDPSAPEYRKTQGTEAMIHEKLKRSNVSGQKHKLNENGDNIKHKKRKSSNEVSSKLTSNSMDSKMFEQTANGDSLDSLIKSVKAKTKQFHNKKKR